jgi:hypothetical protein
VFFRQWSLMDRQMKGYANSMMMMMMAEHQYLPVASKTMNEDDWYAGITTSLVPDFIVVPFPIPVSLVMSMACITVLSSMIPKVLTPPEFQV